MLDKHIPQQYASPFSKIRFHESRLADPLKVRKPAVIAVCFGGDLFHPDVKDEWIDQVFSVMAAARTHTFLVLSKRSERLARYVLNEGAKFGVQNARRDGLARVKRFLPNILLGGSAWDQPSFDALWRELAPLAAAGWRTWCSLEPLLGPISTRWSMPISREHDTNEYDGTRIFSLIVAGCESGIGARPMRVEWAQRIKNECVDAGVPFHFKQAMIAGKLVHLPEIDGKVWDAKPEVQRG